MVDRAPGEVRMSSYFSNRLHDFAPMGDDLEASIADLKADLLPATVKAAPATGRQV